MVLKEHFSGRGQRGQALAETMVVISFVMLPFFVAVPLLAKYQDM